jgi:hypothetical protein
MATPGNFGGGSTGPDQIFLGITGAPPSAPGRGGAQSPVRQKPNPQTTKHERQTRAARSRGFLSAIHNRKACRFSRRTRLSHEILPSSMLLRLRLFCFFDSGPCVLLRLAGSPSGTRDIELLCAPELASPKSQRPLSHGPECQFTGLLESFCVLPPPPVGCLGLGFGTSELPVFCLSKNSLRIASHSGIKRTQNRSCEACVRAGQRLGRLLQLGGQCSRGAGGCGSGRTSAVQSGGAAGVCKASFKRQCVEDVRSDIAKQQDE